MTSPDLRVIASQELERRDLAQDDKKPSRRIESGITGLEVFGGVISGAFADHNRDWVGRNRFDIVDRMRKGDATCHATLMALTLPILSTEMHVESRRHSRDNEPPAIVKEAADFIHHQIFDSGSVDWDEWLREALLYLAFGHYVFEPVWEEISSGPYAGAVGIDTLSPRHPRSIEGWNFNRNGRLVSIKQQGMRTGTEEFFDRDISVDKLIVLTNGPEAGNPLGTSVFRPAYKHWKYKDGYYAVQAIAIERQGAGTPYGKHPAGTKDEELDKAEETLQNLQAHEQSYVMFPEDWEMGFLDMGGNSVLDPQLAINHHDALIPKTVLGQFLGLAQGNTGSFALSEDNSRFFNFTLQATAKYVASHWNRKIIPRLVKWNFGDVPFMPQLRFDSIGHINLKDLVDGIAKLGEKGMMMNSVETENHVREVLNLPPITEDKWEEERERLAQERMMPGERSVDGAGSDNASRKRVAGNGKVPQE